VNALISMQRCLNKTASRLLAGSIVGLLSSASVLAARVPPHASFTYPATSVDLAHSVRTHPNSFVGFTLVADNYGSPIHDASLSERAMIVDVRNGRSFEVLPFLRAVQRGTTQFSQWLPGHRAAIILRASFPSARWGASTDNNDIWFDEYVVDLALGRFFTPTAVHTVGYQNNNLLPFRNSVNSGYLFFAGGGPGLSKEFKMRFNGVDKKPFPAAGNTFGAHGCWTYCMRAREL
jgi:hypothetical protein